MVVAAAAAIAAASRSSAVADRMGKGTLVTETRSIRNMHTLLEFLSNGDAGALRAVTVLLDLSWWSRSMLSETGAGGKKGG